MSRLVDFRCTHSNIHKSLLLTPHTIMDDTAIMYEFETEQGVFAVTCPACGPLISPVRNHRDEVTQFV